MVGSWASPKAEPLVAQVRALLDVVGREKKTVLPDCLQDAFAPWIASTRQWLDLSAGPVDDERLREVADRLQAHRMLIACFAERRG